MEEPLRLAPMTGSRPEDVLRDPMRRLCIIDYQCPLCGQDHETGLYISIPARDLDEYHARLRQITSDWTTLQRLLGEALVELHTERGDLDELVQRARRLGLRETRPPRCELTDESAYTCDDCGHTFETIGLLRKHQGSRRH